MRLLETNTCWVLWNPSINHISHDGLNPTVLTNPKLSSEISSYRSSKISEWYQNSRAAPSAMSKFPAKQAIGRIGVKVLDPSEPFASLSEDKSWRFRTSLITKYSWRTYHFFYFRTLGKSDHKQKKYCNLMWLEGIGLKSTLTTLFSRKPNSPSNDEPACRLDFVNGKSGPKVLECWRIRFLRFLPTLLSTPLGILFLGRIQDKDQRFVRGEVAVSERVVGELDLDLGVGVSLGSSEL